MGEAAKWRLGRQSQVPGMHGGRPVWLFSSAAPSVGRREEEALLGRAGTGCPKLVTVLATSVPLWGSNVLSLRRKHGAMRSQSDTTERLNNTTTKSVEFSDLCHVQGSMNTQGGVS